jgi:membrane protease YdiL (CAAX protease family)
LTDAPAPGDDAPAPRPPTLAHALLAAALLFVVLVAARGRPGPRGVAPGFDGLGGLIGAALPDGGWVRWQRSGRRPDGAEYLVDGWASIGEEVAWVGLQALVLAGAWTWLRRRGGPRLLPDREDADRALSVLAWLVPLVVVAGGGAALVGARVARGAPLERAVAGLVLPLLSRPATAWLPVLRLVVLAPLVEEAAWRGVVFRGLRARLSFAPASVTTALLFGTWHALSGWTQPYVLATQYGFALLACALVERRPDSLGAPVLLHAVGNLAAVGLFALCMGAPDLVLALFGD